METLPYACRPKQRRRRRGGTRAEQAVEQVEKEPGLDIRRIAAVSNIKPNYLDRALRDLVTEEKVKKKDRTYLPVYKVAIPREERP